MPEGAQNDPGKLRELLRQAVHLSPQIELIVALVDLLSVWERARANTTPLGPRR